MKVLCFGGTHHGEEYHITRGAQELILYKAIECNLQEATLVSGYHKAVQEIYKNTGITIANVMCFLVELDHPRSE